MEAAERGQDGAGDRGLLPIIIERLTGIEARLSEVQVRLARMDAAGHTRDQAEAMERAESWAVQSTPRKEIVRVLHICIGDFTYGQLKYVVRRLADAVPHVALGREEARTMPALLGWLDTNWHGIAGAVAIEQALSDIRAEDGYPPR